MVKTTPKPSATKNNKGEFVGPLLPPPPPGLLVGTGGAEVVGVTDNGVPSEADPEGDAGVAMGEVKDCGDRGGALSRRCMKLASARSEVIIIINQHRIRLDHAMLTACSGLSLLPAPNAAKS